MIPIPTTKLMRLGFTALLVLLAACESTLDGTPARLDRAITPTPLPELRCDLVIETITCIDTTGMLLLQTEDQQIMPVQTTNIAFSGTILYDTGTQTIAALEENAVVSAGGVYRLLRPGTQVTLADFGADTPPSQLQPYTLERARLADLNALPRPIVLPQPLTLTADDTVPATTADEPVPAVTGCVPDDEWPFLYTVQRGDTLTRIAGQHDTTLSEIQTANCITDPNTLQPGDVLRVPVNITEGLPEVPARFYADRESVPPGECATLYWQTENTVAVFLNMQQVEPNDTIDVCPSQSSEYTLRVRFDDDAEATYTVRVLVVLSDGTESTP